MKTIFLAVVLVVASLSALANEAIVRDTQQIITKARVAAEAEMLKQPDRQYSFHQMTYTVDANYDGKIVVTFRSTGSDEITHNGGTVRTITSYDLITVELDEDMNVTKVYSSTGGKTIRVRTN